MTIMEDANGNPNFTRTEVVVEKNSWFDSRRLALHVFQREVRDGVTNAVYWLGCASRNQITKDNDGMRHEPLLSMTRDDAQVFMDALYDVGIRPTEGAGSVGQLGAIKAHLEDMRTLVFKTKE